MVMNNINKYLLVTLLLTIWSCSSSPQDKKLLGVDVRLFEDTPAWKLAVAISKDDTAKIRKLIVKDPTLLHAQEPTYGQSVLQWAISRGCYDATRVLLDLGADPNFPAYDGITPFIEACAIDYDEVGFFQLLLAYGGNVNTIANIKNTLHCTPLIAAAGTSLDRVKILVDAGADIDCYCDNSNQSAVFEATLLSKIDILHYLIIEKGADYSRPLFIRLNGTTSYIIDFIEKIHVSAESDKKLKEELLEFMKKNREGG